MRYAPAGPQWTAAAFTNGCLPWAHRVRSWASAAWQCGGCVCGLRPPLRGPWHLQLQEAVSRVLLRPGVGSPTCDGGGPFPDLSGCRPQKPQKNRTLTLSFWKPRRVLARSLLILKHFFSKMVNFFSATCKQLKSKAIHGEMEGEGG